LRRSWDYDAREQISLLSTHEEEKYWAKRSWFSDLRWFQRLLWKEDKRERNMSAINVTQVQVLVSSVTAVAASRLLSLQK
jgi:hypothetical protein